jgi:protein-histidine pros-kinase
MGSDASSLPAQFGVFLETVPDAAVVADRQGRMVLVNAQAAALFGFDQAELVGQPVEMLIPPRFRGPHAGHRESYFLDPRARAMGAAGQLELHGLRKDGSEFPAEISLSPLRTAAGTFAVTAIRDVTARRKVDAKFRALLEASPDAMVIADRQGRIALVNARAEHLFGRAREELLGQPVEILVPERYRRAHREHRARYSENPRPRPMGAGGLELFGLHRDGTEFPVEISLGPLETEDGVLSITAIRDVTERKRVEQERARLHAEVEGARDLLRRELDTQSRDLDVLARDLAARKRDLEAALDAARASRDEADRANRVKGDFLALVSHELRTPLSALLLQVDRLAQDPLPSARARTALPRLTAASHRLTALVEALLAHSRVASGRVEPRREPVDLGRVVDEVVWELRPLAEHKGLALRAQTPGDLAPVETDPALVRVVLANLVGNAVKFTLSGEIAVTVAGGAGDQAISVSDTGPGIPDAERDRIFQPFEHLDPIRAKHLPGVGLGLALVREICSALGARVELRSEVGAGSTFTVRFPVAPAERSGVSRGAPASRA